jgi:hypothetical protein
MVHNVSAILTRPAEYRCDRVSPYSLLRWIFIPKVLFQGHLRQTRE